MPSVLEQAERIAAKRERKNRARKAAADALYTAAVCLFVTSFFWIWMVIEGLRAIFG